MVKLLLFTKKKKRVKECQNHFHIPEPQCQIILLIYPLPMGYKKASLKNRYAPEKKIFQTQEKVRSGQTQPSNGS